jgi:DNA primase small subunit
VLDLDAHERREIVDLVTGKADLKDYLREEAVKSGRRMEGRGYKVPTYLMPTPERGDWKGDLTRETLAFFREIDSMLSEGRRDDAVARFAALADVKPEEAAAFLDFLGKRDSAGHRRLDRLLEERKVDLEDKIRPNFWQRIAEKLYVQMAGEADEPVTADVKRLIRLPSSLHGKTGFVARRLSRDELNAFDPLQDALAFGRSQVKVEGMNDMSFELGGVMHHLEKGKVVALPEHAAVFACLRGSAQIPQR